MAMITCKECGKEISDKATACPNCGAPVQSEDAMKIKHQSRDDFSKRYRQMSSKTKLCKHCKMEIPVNAKVCPHCRKKQSGIFKWVIIILIILFVIGAIAGGGEDKDKMSKVNSSVDNNPQQEDSKFEKESLAVTETTPESFPVTESVKDDLRFKTGETAEYKDVQVTLTSITESEGSEYNKPSAGNVFVLAEFEIENNSSKEIAISSMLSFDAYQDGYSTNLSLTALIEKSGEQLDGSIAPGKKMKGSVGYEIPADYTELEIDNQLDVWSSQKIVFVHEK